jgi:hypothetical protein
MFDPQRLRLLYPLFQRFERALLSAVERARGSSSANDALRGLVITDAEVDQLTTRTPFSDLPISDALHQTTLLADDALLQSEPFAELSARFCLTALDCAIILCCAAPELDRRYERLFAYLQDDVSLKRPTVNLAMNLFGADSAARFAVWERLALPTAPLRTHHLVECLPDPHQREPAFLNYTLKLDTRILHALLGLPTLDARLDTAVRLEAAPTGRRWVQTNDAPMVILESKARGTWHEAAQQLSAQEGFPLLWVDLDALKRLALPFDKACALAVREARLAGAALCLDNWTACLESDGQPADWWWRLLMAYELPVLIGTTQAWEPHDPDRSRRVLRLKPDMLPYDERQRLWTDYAAQSGIALSTDEIAHLAGKFRLSAAKIASAVQTALDYAATRGETVALADVYAGARAQSTIDMGDLAQQITPRYTWDELVLPAEQIAQLREIPIRVQQRQRVLESWGYGVRIARNGGVNALFAGESGTGKTMAAEVIAHELGLILYRIDISAVVSKYIGETEKNLRRVFEAAEASNAVLFFDEADALFGKRSEVKDAHDRYANIEVAYLLQQIEQYDGIVILATNLRQNLDQAFTRRLDFLIDFPFPEPEYRQRIWVNHFPSAAPLAHDLDLAAVSRRYPLAGGNIRNVALAAAYLAAADGGVITMQHLQHAIRREHQKMGRLMKEEQ